MIVCLGVLLASGCAGSSEQWSDDDVAAAFSAETVDDRPELLATMGVPDTFAISWEEVEGRLVQMESWGYHGYATRVDLVDREIVLTTDLDMLDPDALYPGWYDPTAFTALMPMSSAVAIAAASSPAAFQPEAIDLSGGGDDFAQMDLYAGDQIILGFVDEQLVYVESVALAPREAP
jgi:hypothetical protein